MKFLAMILSVLLLTGCAINEPKEVLIPTHGQVPEPPVVEQPFLPIWLLTDEDDSNPDKVVRYYVKSLYMQRLHSEKLQCALDAYRVATEKQCTLQIKEDD